MTNTNCKTEVYKSTANQLARKKLRIGKNEALILYFATKHAFVTSASIKSFYRDIELNPKRIHDAIVRLVKKGILEKVSHGIYRLTEFGKNFVAMNINRIKSIVNSIASQISVRKETEHTQSDGDGESVFKRIRIHDVSNVENVENLVRKLVFVRKVVDCALSYLRSLLGVSRYRRIARSVKVVCVDYFVGGHGVAGLRTRSANRPLIDFRYFESLGLKPKEIGVDVFAIVSGVGKVFVKFYT